MDQTEVDRRIEEVKSRGTTRTVAIPGQRPHIIVVEDGQESMSRPVSAMAGQVDASVPPMVTDAAPSKPRLDQRIGDNYNANHVPDAAVEVALGALVYRPLSVSGWEKRFTANAGDFEIVCEDGYVERSAHAINKLLYDTLLKLSQAAQSKKGK